MKLNKSSEPGFHCIINYDDLLDINFKWQYLLLKKGTFLYSKKPNVFFPPTRFYKKGTVLYSKKPNVFIPPTRKTPNVDLPLRGW